MTTLNISKDTHVSRGDPTYNYGSCNSILLETRGVVNKIGLFEFDISSINVASLTGATFNFHTSWEYVDASPYDIKYTAARLTSSFTEGSVCGSIGSVNWNNQPSMTSVNSSWIEHYCTNTTGGATKWNSINILDMMQDEGGSTFGIYLYLNTPNSDSTIQTRESSYDPYISYTGGEFTLAKINIGDSWKNVSAMKINIGDSWKDVVGIQQNIGDTWKTVF